MDVVVRNVKVTDKIWFALMLVYFTGLSSYILISPNVILQNHLRMCFWHPRDVITQCQYIIQYIPIDN